MVLLLHRSSATDSYGLTTLFQPSGIKLRERLLKCFVACLRHLSRYVLEPQITSENWNSDLIQEATRYLNKDLGLPVHKGMLFDGYYDPSPWFCDYVNLLRKREELTVTCLEDGVEISVAELADCYRQHVGMFDFELIKNALTRTMLLKHYDSSRHRFILDADPIRVSAKRLETVYSGNLRR